MCKSIYTFCARQGRICGFKLCGECRSIRMRFKEFTDFGKIGYLQVSPKNKL